MVTGRARRVGLGALLLALVLIGGGFALSWHAEIAPIPMLAGAFPPDRVAHGATLAALGDCAVCHTATDGTPLAGGRPLPTPFGTVYAGNITPDPQTGLGTWSEAAFRRAMREGIDRAGHHLYPALPYPHFTRATDDDIAALYAFLMTRTPVHATRPPNQLTFPLNFRALVTGWNLLFLRPGPWQPDPAHDAAWNRGAYLVEAIGHCGACHTPHNALGAEETSRLYDGGSAEGWHAPSLTAPARAWTEAELEDYLGTGLTAAHGVAGGPMAPVTAELAEVPATDRHAIAVYLLSRMVQPPPAPAPAETTAGNAVFAGACAGCHGEDAPMVRAGAPSLAATAAVNAPTPGNIIEVILHGLPWREGRAGPFMPPFADTLSDPQIAALAAYVHARYGHGPAWSGIDATVQTARREGTSTP